MSDQQVKQPHTIDEALDRFQLIQGKGDGTKTACVMSAISWVAGEAFTDAPTCAHPNLRALAIQANDAPGVTAAERATILRAGATGLLDTWWVPGVVVAIAQARPKPPEGESLPDETPVARCLRVLAAVSEWKVGRAKPDLRSADLRSADLRSADLRSANLRSADLRSANLGSADLRSANLGSADLRSADLRYADLRSAKNFGLALNITSAYGNKFTVLPAGWSVDEATGLVVADGEVQS